jgi:Fe-S-cluster containining protein
MLEEAVRKCGDCVVCCVYLRIDVPELKKDGMSHCPHVLAAEDEDPGKRVCYNGAGCSIYENRPVVCKDYRCEWLNGHGNEEDRPDRCGILVDRLRGVENAIECKPIWQNAASEKEGWEAIQRISKSKGMPALVMSFYERHLVRVVGSP